MKASLKKSYIVDSVNAMNHQLAKDCGCPPPDEIPHGGKWSESGDGTSIEIEWVETERESPDAD